MNAHDFVRKVGDFLDAAKTNAITATAVLVVVGLIVVVVAQILRIGVS